MFSEPESFVSPPLGMLSKIERIAQRLRGVAADGNGRKVEDG
jgi:hypothetical protein